MVGEFTPEHNKQLGQRKENLFTRKQFQSSVEIEIQIFSLFKFNRIHLIFSKFSQYNMDSLKCCLLKAICFEILLCIPGPHLYCCLDGGIRSIHQFKTEYRRNCSYEGMSVINTVFPSMYYYFAYPLSTHNHTMVEKKMDIFYVNAANWTVTGVNYFHGSISIFHDMKL